MRMFSIRLFLSFLLCCAVAGAAAQTLAGRICDEEGGPVAYATLFCRADGTGITADGDGRFSAALGAGHYEFEVSALGYEAQALVVELDKDRYVEVTLRERVYELAEVNISGGEDPAYGIMRKAIASAPANAMAAREYYADVYVKGSGKVTDVSSFWLKMLDDDEAGEYIGRTFVSENVCRVHFTAPDHYDVEVKASQSSFPGGIDTGILNPGEINIYGDMLLGKVSPLSARSFSLYAFRLEGCYEENGRMVDKIKVTPRYSDDLTLSGYLYVVEDVWCLSGMDVEMSQSGMKLRLKMNCREVAGDVYMPVSADLAMLMSLLGVKVEASFFSSTDYAEVMTGAAGGETAGAAEANPKVTALQHKIDAVMAKDELTAKDAARISRLSKKMLRLSMRDSLSGERRFDEGAYSTYLVRKDSLALCRDSAFWLSHRSVPLSEDERESYMAVKPDSIDVDSSVSVLPALLYGHRFGTRGGWWVETPALYDMFSANAVDGFIVGARVGFGLTTEKGNETGFYPYAYYLTGRRTLNFGLRFSASYAPFRNGRFCVEGGRVTADFAGRNGVNRYVNFISTYVFADNIARFYESRFVSVSNEADLCNGLRLYVAGKYTERAALVNVRDKIGKRRLKPNVPGSPLFTGLSGGKMFHAGGRLEYTPAAYYRVAGGRKRYTGSAFPTLWAAYRHGFGTVGGSTYNVVEGGLRQKVDFLYSSLSYSADAGFFFGSEDVAFPDFKHFRSASFWMSGASFDDSFALLDGYAFSTASSWVCGFANYTSRQLLLKRIPLFSRGLYSEGLHVRFVYAESFPVHSEVGYSLGLDDMARVGVFFSFKNSSYDAFGCTLSLPLFSGLFR